MRQIAVALAAAVLLTGCTAADVFTKGAEYGGYLDRKIVRHLDQREGFDSGALTASKELCDGYLMEARRMAAVDGAAAAESTYEQAIACYEDRRPPIVGIRTYRQELRGAFAPLPERTSDGLPGPVSAPIDLE